MRESPMKTRNGITLSEAKATFDNGNVTSLRIDIILGNYYLVVCTKIADKTLMNARNQEKIFKTLEAIMKDYQYITSKEIKSLLIR